ncbi:RINT1-like protein MAG2 [Glycine soja]|uniref:RINT1-like protein MAG2 n=1 Tax=Glycine soja TaxID=3848 RepID=A0A445GW02_GLYSO|nr:RINT1-like protein MAG2 [Glycine soja]
MSRNLTDYAIMPSLASGMLRNFTDYATIHSFDFRHVTELHGLRNNGRQVPRSGQTGVASQQMDGPRTKLGYISQLAEERVTGIQSSARVLWLHVIDLMIAFDKRIKSLVDHSGITSLMIYNAFLCHLASVIDRCRSLPSVFLRSKFLRFASICIIRNFFDSILIHCQEAEGLTALTDHDVVIKVTISINVAHYFESVLKEWSEDVFFLEMGMDEDDKIEMESNSNSYGEFLPESSKRVIFYDEIKKLEEYRTQWVEKIYLVILRGFDCHSRDYVKNKRQWQKGIEGWIVSKTLIEALDYLQSKMSVVEVSLDGGDFVGVWRSLAAGIDRFIFNGILISNVKFHNFGVEKFGSELEVLFGIFRAWCLRPEGFFFPKSSLNRGVKMRLQQ